MPTDVRTFFLASVKMEDERSLFSLYSTDLHSDVELYNVRYYFLLNSFVSKGTEMLRYFLLLHNFRSGWRALLGNNCYLGRLFGSYHYICVIHWLTLRINNYRT
jgi:hypothetical protein